MGRKKARYENAGNIKSVYTVNFREPEEIIQIFQQFKGMISLEINWHFCILNYKMFSMDINFLMSRKQNCKVLQSKA